MMACPLKFFFLFLISSYFFISTVNGVFSEESHIFLLSKLTHLHFFLHDILEGQNPTVVQIIDPSKNSTPSSGFGTTFMMDDALAEGAELSSKSVGRAQGLFGLASLQQDRGMVMLINFVFTEGIYEGSTLSMLGRNPVLNTIREMPIVGGTGVFRFASGYAIAKSIWSISSKQHFVVEYNVTVSIPS